jgi:hypothetical protein
VGSELMCKARFEKQTGEGKALLETSELIFRGPFRLKIPFPQMKSVKAVDGELRVQFSDAAQGGKSARAKPLVLLEASFALGPLAEKWAHKILHPKTRMEKLGVKPGAKVSLLGELEASFEGELAQVTKAVARGKVAPDAECIFLSAPSAKGLARTTSLAKALKGAAALWIIYPKGREDITETDVIAAGRKAGLKDVKVVGFSATHTALKFVLPLDRR